MKKNVIGFTIVLSLLAVLAAPTMAQMGQQGRDKVEAELMRTDEILERAGEAVRQTDATKARLAYEQAVQLQKGDNGAWHQFRVGKNVLAYQLTTQARERAQAAMAAARTTQQNENALLNRLERANQLMEQVRESLGGTDNEGLRALYGSARENLNQAWRFYRSQQFRASLKLANQVERAARKMLAVANQENRADATYERRVENVHRYMDQAGEMIGGCDSETAARLMEQAREAFRRAQALAGEGNQKAALKALQNARQFAARAARECGGQERLEQRYEQLRVRADRISEQAEPGNTVVRTLLDRAYQQLDLARGYLDNDEYESALAALKAAQLALNEAQRQLETVNR